MSNEAKIRIKIGSMELDYEGDPSFLNGGLEGLLEMMANLSDRIPDAHTPIDTAGAEPKTEKQRLQKISTTTIAAHIDAKTGSELVICALAQLELVQGKSGVDRKEILHEMKSAKSYFTKSIGSNFSKTLVTLTKGKRIHDNGTERYSLSATEKKSIEAKIAEIN